MASSVRRSTSWVCSTAENGPVYEDDQEITPELKRQVHGHYGIERTAGAEDRSAYGDYRSGVERIGATKDPGDLKTATGGAEHEEVPVERVPIAGAEIGEEEAVVPVTETEVVVSKWAVVKEEARVRKAVVEGTEVLEEDVRREEIDVEDETGRRREV